MAARGGVLRPRGRRHVPRGEPARTGRRRRGRGLPRRDRPRLGEITAIPHTGTHPDAPWHYGPEVDGEPARTIDEVPLEWCRGDAVVLDFTWMGPGEEIGPGVDDPLADLDHDLSPGEIVLVETGADDLWGPRST